MPSSNDIYSQIQAINKQYEGYTPANIGDVTKDLMSRVDFMRPQYQELAGMEANAYATPATAMMDYYNKYGTEAGAGPSNMSRLSSILGNIGQQYGTADTLRNVIGAQQGRIGDMARTTLDQYNSGRDALMQRYQMQMPLWQQALQNEENARQRAERAATRSGGGGGYGMNIPGLKGPGTSPYANPRDYYDGLTTLAPSAVNLGNVALSNMYKGNYPNTPTANPNGNYGDILAQAAGYF